MAFSVRSAAGSHARCQARGWLPEHPSARSTTRPCERPIVEPARTEVNGRPHTLCRIVTEGTRSERCAPAATARPSPGSCLRWRPSTPCTVEEIEYDERLDKGGEKFVAWRAAEPVACGGTGRIHHYAPGFDAWWAELAVLDSASRPRARLGALRTDLRSRRARPGSERCTSWSPRRARTASPGSSAAASANGSEPAGSSSTSRTSPPVSPAVAGIEIVTLAQRPELMPAVHAVALEAFADIPGSDEAHFAGSYEEWVARSVDRARYPAGRLLRGAGRRRGRRLRESRDPWRPPAHRLARHDRSGASPARPWRRDQL